MVPSLTSLKIYKDGDFTGEAQFFDGKTNALGFSACQNINA
jgi:hypothetical protein